MRNSRLVIEEFCDHGMVGPHFASDGMCNGLKRTVLDPKRILWGNPGPDAPLHDPTVEDVLDVLLFEEEE